jgi:hypothetical protein
VHRPRRLLHRQRILDGRLVRLAPERREVTVDGLAAEQLLAFLEGGAGEYVADCSASIWSITLPRA